MHFICWFSLHWRLDFPKAKGLSSSIRGFNGLKLLSSNTPVIPKPTVQKLVIVAHTCNSSTQEAETPGFRIQTQPRHSKSCLKTDNIQQSKPSKSSIQRGTSESEITLITRSGDEGKIPNCQQTRTCGHSIRLLIPP